MIYLDETAFRQAEARFNAAVALKIKQMGLNGEMCVRVEAGRLAETMMRLTPPKDIMAARTKIQNRVKAEFTAMTDTVENRTVKWTKRHHALSAGAYGEPVLWYHFTPTGIYGVAQTKDLREASADDLYALWKGNRITKQSRFIAGKRGKQTVYLWQRWLTRKRTVAALARRVMEHVGRAKAGWLVAWDELKNKGYKGKYQPPQYVTNHRAGARGAYVSELGTPGYPTFTLINTAVGMGSKLMREIARRAMELRAKAMVTRLKFLTLHPEKLEEEMDL